MHLMIAAPELGRQWGGIGTYLHQLLGGLGPEHEVTFLTASASPNPTPHSRAVPIATGQSITSVYANFQIALRRRLPELFREYRPDLFVANHAQMPDILVRRALRDPPFITIAHTTARGQARAVRRAARDRGPMDQSERVTLMAAPAVVPAEIYYWHRVRNAIFVSDVVRREVQGISTAHLEVSATVPNGIDPDEVRREARVADGHDGSEGATIIYSSRMLGMKGLATLFHALRLLPPGGWSVRLAGAGDQGGWVRFARSLGLDEKSVEFLGPLPRVAVLELLQRSAMFILPSYYESCPFSLLEAMALGVPCIATSIPGITAMVADGESALLVPPGDAQSLARAIQTLLQNPEQGEKLAAAARQVASDRFNVARMREATLQAFERVLAAG